MFKLFTSRSLAVTTKIQQTSGDIASQWKCQQNFLTLNCTYASIDNDHTYFSRCKTYFKHTENTDHKNIFEMALRLIIAVARLS